MEETAQVWTLIVLACFKQTDQPDLIGQIQPGMQHGVVQRGIYEDRPPSCFRPGHRQTQRCHHFALL